MSRNKKVRARSRVFVVTLAWVMAMTLSVPVFAQGYGRFVSNTPMPAGPYASLEEVWLKHGGARLQFDALMGPIQVNTNGRPWRDPVMVDYLPPLYPKKHRPRLPAPTTKDVKKTQPPCPEASNAEKKLPNASSTLSPVPSRIVVPQAATEKPAPAQDVKGSGNGLDSAPYTGPASPSPAAPDLKEMGQNGSLSQVPESKEYQDPFHYH